jgi:multiple sugar transport system ATP-binding protein/alpha-glucoside transport system ATP-binding protein
MANLQLTNVKKAYGDIEVIHGVDLQIDDGEFVVFVGPSGCGKSTLLRMIAGLEEISGGTVEIGGTVVNDVAPSKRGVAMVFQTYALYPHMTVKDNVAFGLKQAKTDPAEIERRVAEAAEMLQITEYLDRKPKNLSGGQRQRVAIGRAIARHADVFLFDEPLSNLDAALRVQTRLEIARLHARLDATMIYVTHDQVEALTLADKIVVLHDGYISQVGSPMELYERPQNIFVAGFIGSPKMNLVSAVAKGGKIAMSDTASITAGVPDGRVVVGLRPEHLKTCSPEDAMLVGKLDMVEKLGEYALVHMTGPNGESLIAKFETPPAETQGDRIFLKADDDKVHIFDEKSGQRL